MRGCWGGSWGGGGSHDPCWSPPVMNICWSLSVGEQMHFVLKHSHARSRARTSTQPHQRRLRPPPLTCNYVAMMSSISFAGWKLQCRVIRKRWKVPRLRGILMGCVQRRKALLPPMFIGAARRRSDLLAERLRERQAESAVMDTSGPSCPTVRWTQPAWGASWTGRERRGTIRGGRQIRNDDCHFQTPRPPF